jgi:hypothetical protein
MVGRSPTFTPATQLLLLGLAAGVRPPETGSASPSGSLLPPWPVPRRHERAAATRNGTIPRLTEINSSLPPQPANVQPTPRH